MKRSKLFVWLMIACSFFGTACEASGGKSSDMNDSTQAAEAADQWFFRSVSGSPTSVTFQPVVLFANGDYYDVGDEPVEGLDKAANKLKRPAAWGTWKKTGDTYVLINHEGKSHDYTLGNGNWFPAYPYSSSVALKKSYENTSGGDYGNGMTSLSIDKIAFTDATHFTQGTNSGTSTPNVKAGKTSSGGGTYKIYGHTIELTMSDGRTIKKSFALGASGRPPKPVTTMIFIGGDAYTDTE